VNPHRLTFLAAICFVLTLNTQLISAQKPKAPPGGRIAIVVDERLSALRATPDLRASLVRRLGRGRLVAIKSVKTSRDGIVFLLVNASRRTHGWIQREAVVIASRAGDDKRLLSLIKSSVEFDRIVRARIFLDYFPRSTLRAQALLLMGDAAEQASEKLTRDSARRLAEEFAAPEFSYFLNYSGLDRYNRQGVTFVFDQKTRRLHYDGSAWREIVRRFPHSAEAEVARSRLVDLSVSLD
jgi:hypothetical protein